MPKLPDRSQSVTMTLSVNDDHIGRVLVLFSPTVSNASGFRKGLGLALG